VGHTGAALDGSAHVDRPHSPPPPSRVRACRCAAPPARVPQRQHRELLRLCVWVCCGRWGLMSMVDIVLNHTASNSWWLSRQPEACYNLDNSPHLRGAFELDQVRPCPTSAPRAAPSPPPSPTTAATTAPANTRLRSLWPHADRQRVPPARRAQPQSPPPRSPGALRCWPCGNAVASGVVGCGRGPGLRCVC
jgi:hypothetical protein